jgi:hypothetical protein
VEQYYLAAKSVSGVQVAPDGVLQVLSANAVKLPDGTLQAKFDLRVPESVAERNYICNSMCAPSTRTPQSCHCVPVAAPCGRAVACNVAHAVTRLSLLLLLGRRSEWP